MQGRLAMEKDQTISFTEKNHAIIYLTRSQVYSTAVLYLIIIWPKFGINKSPFHIEKLVLILFNANREIK